jgi:hypothetical protein
MIYQLGKTQGETVTVFQTSTDTVDLETGAQTRAFDSFDVRWVLIMTNRNFYDFVYDLAYIAAGKNFTMGAHFDMNQRKLLIRKRNIPSGKTLKLSDHVQFNGKRWEINEMGEFENERSVLILSVSNVGGSGVVS